MSINRVREYLKKYDLDKKIKEFNVSSATVHEASLAIGCKEKDIAKTLSFLVEDKPILIVVRGDAKIDNSKYKKEFHKKAKMIPSDMLEEIIGHKAGGVCPFGVKENVKIYLDESLKTLKYFYPACGSSNSAIKMDIDTIEKIVNYVKWVDVCKIMEEENV